MILYESLCVVVEVMSNLIRQIVHIPWLTQDPVGGTALMQLASFLVIQLKTDVETKEWHDEVWIDGKDIMII